MPEDREPPKRFDAQGIVKTETRSVSNTFEITFVDARGETMVLTLPAQMAADMLPAIAKTIRFPDDSKPPWVPRPVRNVRSWRTGNVTDEPTVLLIANDDPALGFRLDDAKKLWRQLREEAELVERRPPPRRQ